MKYVIACSIGFVAGMVGGFFGAKVKEWLDMKELKEMVIPFDEDDDWDGK